MTNKITIHLASPRGFCAGVDRAIEIVKKTIKKYGTPVYVRHEIVHNKYVVENLKKQGVIFVEELDEIDDKSRPVIFSAHGVPKSVPDSAKIKKIFSEAGTLYAFVNAIFIHNQFWYYTRSIYALLITFFGLFFYSKPLQLHKLNMVVNSY